MWGTCLMSTTPTPPHTPTTDSWWIGKSRAQLNAEAIQRAPQMSATSQSIDFQRAKRMTPIMPASGGE